MILILTKNLINFFKTVKSTCNNKNEFGGLVYNGERFAINSRNTNMIFYIENGVKQKPISLPLIAINYISSFSEGSKITFEPSEDGKLITVKSGRSRTQFSLMSYYQIENCQESDNDFTIQKDDFFSAIKKVAIAADRAATKALCASIHIRNVDGKLTAYATNGVKLAISNLKSDVSTEFSVDFHIENVKLITSLFSDDNITVVSSENKRKIIFKDSHTTLIIPMIDCGAFEYQKIVSECLNKAYNIEVNRHTLVELLSKAAILTDNNARVNPCKMTISKEKITFALTNALTSFEDSVEVESSNAFDDITIGVYLDNILTALTVISSENVNLCFSGSLKPIIISDKETLFLIMPVRYT